MKQTLMFIYEHILGHSFRRTVADVYQQNTRFSY